MKKTLLIVFVLIFWHQMSSAQENQTGQDQRLMEYADHLGKILLEEDKSLTKVQFSVNPPAGNTLNVAQLFDKGMYRIFVYHHFFETTAEAENSFRNTREGAESG